MAAGEVDLIAFTSTAQIRRLKKVAETAGLQDALRHAMSSLRVAAVGPVTAAAVEKAGWRVAMRPPASFHLNPFVAELPRALGAGPRTRAPAQSSEEAGRAPVVAHGSEGRRRGKEKGG